MYKLFIYSFFLLCMASNPVSAFAQNPGYPFEVKITGAGKGKQALLFLPGFACSGSVWDETVAHYQPMYSCYTFTMGGFAGAPPQPSPSLAAWVEGLARYINDNKIENPVIIGHSLGGGMALMLAAGHPELVSGIVIVDALPCLNALMNPGFKTQTNPDCQGVIDQMTKTTNDQFYQMQKSIMPRLIADTHHLEQVVQWSMLSDRKTFAGIYCEFSNTDLRETIKDIRCPALILLEAPFAAMKPAVEAQYQKLAHARLLYAGQGLHFIMYDDKPWYLQQVDTFLKH